MASGGKDKEDKEIEELEKDGEQPKDEGGNSKRGLGGWVMSGLQIGAALKIGAVLGVTTLGAAGLGAAAVGAYAAMKMAKWDEEDTPTESCGGEDEEQKGDKLSPLSEEATSDEGAETTEAPAVNLVDDLNEYYSSHVMVSSAKIMAIQDFVEKVRQPLSSCLIKYHGSLIKEELAVAAFDKLITKRRDERRLMLPLAFDPQMWELIDAADTTLEMPGYFCLHRVNLDSFSIGASPWDPFLVESYLSPDLLREFWMKNIKQILAKEKILTFDWSIKWNAGDIELYVENPVKGYADMLCIKIFPCMKFEKDREQITISAQLVTPSQEPAGSPGGDMSNIPQEHLWLQYQEEAAMNKMETLDADGGCRRKCLQIMDALLSSHPPLKMLSLYHIMTILLEVCEEETEWDEEMLAERFLDLLKALEEHLRAGGLRDHFNDKIDLLAQCCSPEEISDSQQWLAHMLESKERISDLLYDLVFKAAKH